MTIEVVEFFQSLQNGFFDVFFNMISFLGEEYIYIFVLGIVYYAFDKKLGEYLAFTLFFTGIFNNTLKVLFNHMRPFEKYPDRVNNLRPDTATGNSFPSGHTQNFSSFLFAGGFHFKKYYIFIIATVLSVLMAISRMYLGVHFLEDVVASLVLGIVTAFVISIIFNKVNDKQLHLIYIGILVVFFPIMILIGEEDLFKSYGLMFGFLFAMIYEKKYVQFTYDITVLKKVLRVVSGLIVMVGIQSGVGMVFDLVAEEGTFLLNILDLVRYALIAFVGLGLYPTLFKKFHF